MILNQKVLFSKEECESIIWKSNQDVANFDIKNRKYHSQPINYSLETKWLFDKLKTFFEEQSNTQIKKNKEVIHFHKLTKGDWFGKHNDIRDNRVYAVGILLNDNFEGGDFKLHDPNKVILNKPFRNINLKGL